MKSEMKHRVTEREKVSCVVKKIWRGERMLKYAKRSMDEVIVVPTFLYGSEVWTASAEDTRRMCVKEMKCMRAMCSVSIMDRVRNEEVQRRCGSELSIGE
jgi:hypothetical protein